MNKNDIRAVRLYQETLKIGRMFFSFNEPITYVGVNKIREINHILFDIKHQIHNVLIVTGKNIFKTDLLSPLFEVLKKNGINYSVFCGIESNPTIEQVEEGVLSYKENKCEAIIAVGGGSIIDAGKCIGARVSNPKTSLEDMQGLLKVKNNIPLLIAIPTTSGSGSDASFSSVITNEKTGRKVIVTDFKLLPKYVILDPNLTLKLNKEQIAYSGMDALTHDIEAYISRAHTRKSDSYAISSAKTICENLELAYTNNGGDMLKIHENLLVASHEAGLAFSRAYVGFCHAISHAIGGKYNLPHGYLNAIILPFVLRAYGESAVPRLAALADNIAYRINISDDKKAEWVINRVESLNSYLGIKNKLQEYIKPEDIDELATRAFDEATPLYPAPKMLSIEEIKNILIQLCK